MNARSIRNRLLSVERKFQPSRDTSFTLEELCRAMWRSDKQRFLERSEGTNYVLFARQFEFEDLERVRIDNQRRGRE